MAKVARRDRANDLAAHGLALPLPSPIETISALGAPSPAAGWRRRSDCETVLASAVRAIDAVGHKNENEGASNVRDGQILNDQA